MKKILLLSMLFFAITSCEKIEKPKEPINPLYETEQMFGSWVLDFAEFTKSNTTKRSSSLPGLEISVQDSGVVYIDGQKYSYNKNIKVIILEQGTVLNHFAPDYNIYFQVYIDNNRMNWINKFSLNGNNHVEKYSFVRK